MGVVEEVSAGGTEVRLAPRMFPPPGATLVVLGGPGAGQTRLVTTGKVNGSYSIDRPFDAWLALNVSKVAALPTAGHKLIVGNTFIKTSVVQWFSNTIHGVHADNTFTGCNARSGIGGVEIGGALQVAGLCYKGAPGQVFYTEFLGNTLEESDGITLVDNFGNTQMNDCAQRGWFSGPWVQWIVLRRNSFAGVSQLARHDAKQAGTTPRCGAVVQRAFKIGNTTDLVAEHQQFSCPAGALKGGYDVVGCDHCAIRN